MRSWNIPAATSSGSSAAAAPSGRTPSSTWPHPLQVTPSDVELRIMTEAGAFPVLKTPNMNNLSPSAAAATAEPAGEPGGGTSVQGLHILMSAVDVRWSWPEAESRAITYKRSRKTAAATCSAVCKAPGPAACCTHDPPSTVYARVETEPSARAPRTYRRPSKLTAVTATPASRLKGPRLSTRLSTSQVAPVNVRVWFTLPPTPMPKPCTAP